MARNVLRSSDLHGSSKRPMHSLKSRFSSRKTLGEEEVLASLGMTLQCGSLRSGAILQLRRILLASLCLVVAVCLHAPVALAQHGGGAHGGFGGGHYGGGGHFGGGGHSGGGRSAGGAHVGAPRSSTPGPSAPGPTFGMRTWPINPRMTALPPTTFNTSNFRQRPVPRPIPPPVSIIYIPVYYSPFFYGGFNSFWGCDPFWGWGGCYSPYGFGYGGFGYGGWGWGYGGYGGYGGYYGGFYGNYGLGGFGGPGLDTGSNVYSSSPGAQATTPQTYVSPSYPTDTRARDLVELFFKDGTVFNVTDYWLADGQLHFLTVEERGEKAVEHVLPFDTLDLQTTVDVNTGRGFKFQLRGESMEQYFRNHPEVVPKVDPEAPSNQ